MLTKPPGTATKKLCVTGDAAVKALLPAWVALMLQVPGASVVNWPPAVIVQTLVVWLVNVTGRPDVDVAVRVGVVPKFCVPGLLNVIVCAWVGVTALLFPDSGPTPA